MPTKVYFLDDQKTESIGITWGFNWKNVSITYAGKVIGTIAHKAELKKGQLFNLTDYKDLSVKLKGEWNPELELLVNGKEIPDSPTDPNLQLYQTFKAAIGLGILNVLVGLLSSMLNISFLTNLGIGFSSAVLGLIVIALSYGVKRRSRLALAAIIALFMLDIMATFYFLDKDDFNPTSGVILKIIIIIFLLRGFPAIKKLNERSIKQGL